MHSTDVGMSDAQIGTLVGEIDTRGYGVIPGYVSPPDLQRMRDFAAAAVERNNGEYAGFTGPAAVAGSGLDELASSRAFRTLMERVYERGTGRSPPPDEFYQVMRCLSGQSVAKHSLLFHYDSYVLTSLIPIEIPTEGKQGDFLMFPNTRRIRSTYARNVADKVLLDNRLTQMALRTAVTRRWVKHTRIKMVPGDLYFFWGYRSIHTNEGCDVDKIRSTALFHYVNPHDKAAAAARQPQAMQAA